MIFVYVCWGRVERSPVAQTVIPKPVVNSCWAAARGLGTVAWREHIRDTSTFTIGGKVCSVSKPTDGELRAKSIEVACAIQKRKAFFFPFSVFLRLLWSFSFFLVFHSPFSVPFFSLSFAFFSLSVQYGRN